MATKNNSDMYAAEMERIMASKEHQSIFKKAHFEGGVEKTQEDLLVDLMKLLGKEKVEQLSGEVFEVEPTEHEEHEVHESCECGEPGCDECDADLEDSFSDEPSDLDVVAELVTDLIKASEYTDQIGFVTTASNLIATANTLIAEAKSKSKSKPKSKKPATKKPSKKPSHLFTKKPSSSDEKAKKPNSSEKEKAKDSKEKDAKKSSDKK